MSRRLAVFFFVSCVLLCGLCSCATENNRVGTTASSFSEYIKGLLNERCGDLKEAAAFYKQAQGLDQEAPALHVQLGLDYLGLKRFKDAALEFEKALDLSPDDTQARYVLALLYVQLNDTKKSCEEFEKLLEKNISSLSKNIQLRHILSQLYFLDRDYAKAKLHSEKILQLRPEDALGLYMTAGIACEEGRIQEAIDGFKRLLGLYPESPDAMNALAYLYAERNIELDQALDLVQDALAYDDFNAAYLDTLGWIYFKLAATDKAIEALQKAAGLMPDPVIYDHLAQSYYKKGLNKEAKKYWTLSLSLDPEQESVRGKLKGL